MRSTWPNLLAASALFGGLFGTAGCAVDSTAGVEGVLVDGVTSASSAVGYIIDDVPGRQTGPHCTGTLVAPRVVLTAAHCILSPKEISLIYGVDAAKYGIAFGMGKVRDNKRVRAVKAVIHPDYDPTHEHPTDLAYLVLESDVTTAAPAKLALHRERCDYEAIGYGPKTRASNVTDERSRASVCAKGGFDKKGFIQAVASQGTVCFGFGGGPLSVPGETEIMGVLSWGEAWCAEDTTRANYFAPIEHPDNVAFVREALAQTR